MAVIANEDFLEEFEMFSINVDGSSDTMEKLRQLCDFHTLTAGELVEEWMAYTATKKQSGLKVTQETLDQLDRELSKKKMKKINVKTPSSGRSAPPRIAMYNIDNIHLLFDEDDAEDQLLNSYCTPVSGRTPVNKRHAEQTPPGENGEGRILKKRTANGGGGLLGPSVLPFSPQSFSPASGANMSVKYAARTNRGEVVCSFGECPTDMNWARKELSKNIKVTPFEPASYLGSVYKHMIQKPGNKAAIMDDMIEEIGQRYKDIGLIEHYSYLVVPTQDEVSAVGRICCDSNGKMNARSIQLEGSRDASGGRTVSFAVSNLPQYSLFPGQVVAVEGSNSSGTSFTATKLHDGIFLPSPPAPVIDKELTLVVACGPFTTSDNLSYDPLVDLLTYLTTTTPDVCVLFGPFVDSKHVQLESGDLNMTYEMLFSSKLRLITEVTHKFGIELVVVPSQRDLHHEPVYPQPPFIYKSTSSTVHFAPDPCTLSINGLVIGLTSTDILFHLGAEEISCVQAGVGVTDRISRLIGHVLTQHNYYPLFPPAADVNMDVEHFDTYGRLNVTPHLLILPSDLRHFIKGVGETVCVNPGRLVKVQVGGTFARIVLRPPTANVTDIESLHERISSEVLRI